MRPSRVHFYIGRNAGRKIRHNGSKENNFAPVPPTTPRGSPPALHRPGNEKFSHVPPTTPEGSLPISHRAGNREIHTLPPYYAERPTSLPGLTGQATKTLPPPSTTPNGSIPGLHRLDNEIIYHLPPTYAEKPTCAYLSRTAYYSLGTCGDFPCHFVSCLDLILASPQRTLGTCFCSPPGQLPIPREGWAAQRKKGCFFLEHWCPDWRWYARREKVRNVWSSTVGCNGSGLRCQAVTGAPCRRWDRLSVHFICFCLNQSLIGVIWWPLCPQHSCFRSLPAHELTLQGTFAYLTVLSFRFWSFEWYWWE